MKNTELSQFTLQKVKTKGQGLEATFEVQETTGVEVYHDLKTVKSDKTPHPDLTAIIKVFRGYMGEIFYFSTIRELIDSKVFMPDINQTKILASKYNELESKITVTGVSVSGKEENKGLIITAKLKTETGQEVAINSQRIKFNGTKYGFEEDLESLITDLEQEVFEYVINSKQAQIEMAFDDEPDGKTKAAGVEKDDDGQLDMMEQALNDEEKELEEQEEETEEKAEE